MKLKTTLTFFSLLVLALFLMNNVNGPGNAQGMDFTGSPISSGSCNNLGCHSGGTFNPAVTIQVMKDAEVVDEYMPGETYDVRVTITAGNGTPSAYGFQAVALNSSNANAGEWGDPPAGINKLTLANSRTYIEHSTPNTTSNSFEVEWTAPAADAGDVTFYAAGNAVDGSSTSLGDQSNTTQLTIAEGEPVSVRVEPTLSGLSLFPNPAIDEVNVKVSSRTGGVFGLKIIDANGRTVQTHQLDLDAGPNDYSLNVGDFTNGLYLIQLSDGNEMVTQTLLKM